jgi:hypothetical protein
MKLEKTKQKIKKVEKMITDSINRGNTNNSIMAFLFTTGILRTLIDEIENEK